LPLSISKADTAALHQHQPIHPLLIAGHLPSTYDPLLPVIQDLTRRPSFLNTTLEPNSFDTILVVDLFLPRIRPNCSLFQSPVYSCQGRHRHPFQDLSGKIKKKLTLTPGRPPTNSELVVAHRHGIPSTRTLVTGRRCLFVPASTYPGSIKLGSDSTAHRLALSKTMPGTVSSKSQAIAKPRTHQSRRGSAN
jgi:hypothetical protein